MEIARSEAIIAAREIVAEQISFGVQVGDQAFEATDEEGFIFFRLAFRDLLHSRDHFSISLGTPTNNLSSDSSLTRMH